MAALEDTIFTSRFERAFFAGYRRLFSAAEIAEQQILQWALAALAFGYFISFNSRFYSHTTTLDAYLKGSYTCWPYFQSCGRFYFLRTLPEGYSQPFIYMVLFGLLILSVYLMWRREWTLAQITLLPSFFWHAFVSFLMSMSTTGNYDHYLFIFGIVLLFLPYKEFFLKLFLVLFYYLSTIAKIHPTWIEGTYFSALRTGLPLFPDWAIPVLTNLIIAMEMVGVWFLLGRNWVLQRLVLVFFIIFHLYSGLLVGYHYPATVLPMLIILFGPLYAYTRPPLTRRAIVPWLLVGFVVAIQFIPVAIPGDEKLTLEGNYYGLYMFEANHQCVSHETIRLIDGTTREVREESYSARHRCDPYHFWFRIKTECDRHPEIASIAWTFDHSINGGPFLRIVDARDACALSYQPFSHNAWIKTAADHPAVIGYPVQNVYD